MCRTKATLKDALEVLKLSHPHATRPELLLWATR